MLPPTYRRTFEALVAQAAGSTVDAAVPLTPFWPLRGTAYVGELLVIGRSVNGWVDDWTTAELRDADQRRAAVDQIRADAEPPDRDRMAWVSELWSATTGYSTKRSAFWRVARRLVTGDLESANWPSHLVWTNLYKVAPAAGWNPGADLQRAQRALAIDLLNQELDAFQPIRILAMTGSWIQPFADGLGLSLRSGAGLVEHIGDRSGVAVVVAKHPMAKPEDQFVSDVREAFAALGQALPVE